MEAQQEKSKSKQSYGWWLLVLVLAALTVVDAAHTIWRYFDHSDKTDHVPGHPGKVSEKYADALQIALQFFHVQKSGKLENNKIGWRGYSGLEDGREENLDLLKGMYDAGDLMKFGFPMAFTATMLSWAILEYGYQMNAAKQLGDAQDSLQWITDYFINAHPSENVLYIQVVQMLSHT